ncbi:MAG: right-handed parallel beta-helix repeat-containing protein [Bacteroidales bacterium]|nr:right-handed parallel beta-helix repeat-containing protein [Bacteroidales bacterium]
MNDTSFRLKNIFFIVIGFFCISQKAYEQDLFPDGSVIPDWFIITSKPELNDLGKQYFVTDYGAVLDSTIVQTTAIQNTINEASRQGGGVVVVPKGVFLSGALFFKPKTHLYISEGAVLKGSDNISDYPIMASRMEGQCLDYFPALINAYGLDGFIISGKGTINGNGLKYWKAFWKCRRKNAECTNLEVSRPRLVFIWNCDNVQLQDVKLINSAYWTTHFYKCNNVKMIDLHIFSPIAPVKAPSTDAIDIDACSNFLIKGCDISVNDDGISLKGGKGPWADKDTCNGSNLSILIENCKFGYCHSALTCGSESIHNKNIIMRNCQLDGTMRMLWFKVRPDTPQKFEYITVENISGNSYSCIYIKPWRQFYDLKGREDEPQSYCENISIRNIHLKCNVFYDLNITKNDHLSKFVFEDIDVETTNDSIDKSIIDNITLRNVKLNGNLAE